MITYDAVLEDLPERMQELTLRLRDLVLSMGSGIVETVRGGGLEYALERPFCGLAPDARGVTLTLPGAHKTPLGVEHAGITYTPKGAVLRIVTMSDLDDALRRVCRAAFQRAQERSPRAAELAPAGPDLPAAHAEALANISRGLRLWMHQIEVVRRTTEQRARSAERAGQRRSHKKKPPAAAPTLVVADAPSSPAPVPAPSAAAPRPAHKPASDKRPAKAASPKPASPKAASPKTASSKAASPKAASPKAASSKAASPKAASPKAASSKPGSSKAAAPKPASPKAASHVQPSSKPARSPSGKPPPRAPKPAPKKRSTRP